MSSASAMHLWRSAQHQRQTTLEMIVPSSRLRKPVVFGLATNNFEQLKQLARHERLIALLDPRALQHVGETPERLAIHTHAGVYVCGVVLNATDRGHGQRP